MPEWMTVEYFMAYLKPFYPAWDDARADSLLRQFDLPRDRKLRHLSRGMRVKAALASSLAYRPQLVVLDEPFTGLDPFSDSDNRTCGRSRHQSGCSSCHGRTCCSRPPHSASKTPPLHPFT